METIFAFPSVVFLFSFRFSISSSLMKIIGFFQSFLAAFAMGGTQIFAEFFLSNHSDEPLNFKISRLWWKSLAFFNHFGHPLQWGDFSRFFFLSKHSDETLSFKSLMESLAVFNHFVHLLQWGDFSRFFSVKPQWWNIKFQVFDGVKSCWKDRKKRD